MAAGSAIKTTSSLSARTDPAQEDAIWEEIRQNISNVLSDRSRTWAPPGQPQRRPWPWRKGMAA